MTDEKLPETTADAGSSGTQAAEEIETISDAPPAVDLTSIPETLPLLPMEDAVLYPFTIVPLAFDDEPLIGPISEDALRFEAEADRRGSGG